MSPLAAANALDEERLFASHGKRMVASVRAGYCAGDVAGERGNRPPCVEAWNSDDLDAFLAELDADVEWHPSIEPGLEGPGTIYRGHDGVRRAWREYRGEGAWDLLRSRPQELRDLGEAVLLLGAMDLTARTTGIEFSREVGELIEFRAGKITRARDFLTHAEALEAAGLRE